MTKSIQSLIPDIYAKIQDKSGWFNDELASNFSIDVGRRLQGQLGTANHKPSLRLSAMGPRCPCALWYSIHRSDLAEGLPPWAEIKYAYGHILEAMALTLAKAAGHQVTGAQDELILDSIVGHRDCVIDGCTVDVKSASTISFNKFKSGQFQDTFGYLDQLDGYVLAAAQDPLVTVKDKGYLLVIDKTLGHMCLYKHEVTDERKAILRARIVSYKSIVAGASPPSCTCGTVADGASGNIKLDLKASYSPYKYCCHPHLRTFIYASGPTYLTKVVRIPGGNVKEVDKFGKTVYN